MCKKLLTILCILAVTPLTARGQAGANDGPITARAFDAAFVRTKMTDAIRQRIGGLDRGAAILEFVDDPLAQTVAGKEPPSRQDLEQARLVAAGKTADEAKNAVAGASGAVGFTHEATFLYGLADFVIARTKTELTLASFRQARKWFELEPLLITLFPASRVIIADPDNSAGPQMVALLRTAARKDIAALPRGVWKVVEAQCTSDTTCPTRPLTLGAIDALRVGATLAESFERRESPISGIMELGQIPSTEFKTRGGRIGSRLAAVTAGEVSHGGAQRFVAAIEKQELRPYTVALLADTLVDSISKIELDSLQARLLSLSRAVQSFEDAYQEFVELRDAHSSSAAEQRERYAALAQAFSSSVDRIGHLAITLAGVDEEGRVFVEALTVACSVTSAIASQDYLSAATQGLSLARSTGVPIPVEVSRWVAFAGGVSTAKQPEEVAAILEEFALPPASYATKRYSPASQTQARSGLFINSYLGLSGGGEWLGGSTRQSGGNGRAAYGGVSLPIGAEIALGDGKQSLFLSVLDLGTVANYRFAGSSDQTSPPNITFANVIAPGAFLTWGLGSDFPLAFGLGWQYAPKLRSLVTGEKRDATRFGVFLAADIPLFRIR